MFKIKIAVFPGRFEPITLKHLNILKQALNLFDKIIILVLNNQIKKSIISVQNRLELIKLATNNLPTEVDYWENLLIDYAEVVGACAIVKGIQNTPEFVKELEMCNINKILNPNIQTVFLPVAPQYSHITSELVLKLAKHNKNLDKLIPATTITQLTKILSEV